MQRKLDDQKTVHHDKADGEGGHFTGHQTEDACHVTQRLPFPRPSLPQELTLVEQVSDSDSVQVQTHHEVRQSQACDKDVETRSGGLLLKEQSVKYKSRVRE